MDKKRNIQRRTQRTVTRIIEYNPDDTDENRNQHITNHPTSRESDEANKKLAKLLNQTKQEDKRVDTNPQQQDSTPEPPKTEQTCASPEPIYHEETNTENRLFNFKELVNKFKNLEKNNSQPKKVKKHEKPVVKPTKPSTNDKQEQPTKDSSKKIDDANVRGPKVSLHINRPVEPETTNENRQTDNRNKIIEKRLFSFKDLLKKFNK